MGWKLLSDKNETNYLKKVYAPTIVDEKDGDATQYRKTYICHPKRNMAHPYETALGYEGPMNFRTLLNIFANEYYKVELSDDGKDKRLHHHVRILFHNGVYGESHGNTLFSAHN